MEAFHDTNGRAFGAFDLHKPINGRQEFHAERRLEPVDCEGGPFEDARVGFPFAGVQVVRFEVRSWRNFRATAERDLQPRFGKRFRTSCGTNTAGHCNPLAWCTVMI